MGHVQEQRQKEKHGEGAEPEGRVGAATLAVSMSLLKLLPLLLLLFLALAQRGICCAMLYVRDCPDRPLQQRAVLGAWRESGCRLAS